jgi:hypothetical protein
MMGCDDVKRKTIASLIIILIIAVAAIAFAFHFNGNSMDFSNRQVLLIVTDSMDGDVHEYEIDSFPKNTFVMVKHLSEEEKLQIKVGDVLSFWKNGILIHHRVTDLHLDIGEVTTMGDNTHSHETVELGDINGKVVGTSPLLGQVVSFVKANFIIVIIALVALAIVCEIVMAYRRGASGKNNNR